MTGGIGTAEISKRYPVASSTGVDENDYHKDREIFLEPEDCSKVSEKVKKTL